MLNQSFDYSELDEELDDIQFRETRSSASCKIDDIQGFMFGGQSARFWMLRKQINNMGEKQFAKLPFLSWHCITLYL